MKTVLETTLVRAGLFFAILLFTSSTDAQLVHPGGWHTQSDLTASEEFSRLQVDNKGVVKFVSETQAGDWESFTFIEVR